MPCAADARRLFNNDEVVTFVALDQVNGHTHSFALSVPLSSCLYPSSLTRYTGSNDYNRRACVISIPHRNLGPWLCATHVVFAVAIWLI